MMTHEELDNIPEIGGISYIEIKPGDPDYPEGGIGTIRRPVMSKGRCMTRTRDDAALVIDRHGAAWSTGRIDGVLHKQRMMAV